MVTTPRWRFGPFCLDPARGSRWRDETLVPLRPKPLALLAYLVAHVGQVVTKNGCLGFDTADLQDTQALLHVLA